MKNAALAGVALGFCLLPAAAAAQGVGELNVGAQGTAQAPAQVNAQGGVYVQSQPQAQPVYQQPQPVYQQQPQPQYVYAQPQQPQVVVVQGGGGRARRLTVPYNGGPVPAGARVEERGSMPLIVTGSVLFGVTYGISLLTGLACTTACGRSGLGWLVVPVAGPLISLGGFPQDEVGARFLVLDSIVQAAGLTMLIVGAALRYPVLVYDNVAARNRRRAPQWAVAPGAPGAGASGLSFSLTHF